MEQITLGESGGRPVELPCRYLTRHGIIAGSTGTGKSRAMQVLAEQLADAGVSVFVSDVKGDASGFCIEGKQSERNSLAPYEPHEIKTDYWSVSDRFARFRFSVGEVGSVLFSRVLSLNPTQESHLALAFSYARKNHIPVDTTAELLDLLDDLIEKKERGMSASSMSVIQRKILALEESGLGRMFGRPCVELSDLKGLNVLNLSDARQDMAVTMAPAFLLNKLFSGLPEAGDVEIPKFVIFFDEAHYLFKDANKSLKDLMVTILKQIRSKGVAVFFVTQDVSDLPEEILSQLSTKIIFAQKVFTEKGTARLRALAKSFPNSGPETGNRTLEQGLARKNNTFYYPSQTLLETLKTLPPGVALLSTLDKNGNQTEAVQVKVFAPATTMEIVPDAMLRRQTDQKLIEKYAKSATAKKIEKPKAQEKTQQKAFAPPPEPPPLIRPAPQPVRVKEIVVEKKVVRKTGPSAWDVVFGFLLTLVDFLLKLLGMLFGAIIFRPLKSFFKWLLKKPVRVVYFLVFLIVVYVLVVNWPLIQSLLEKLKLS